MATVTRVTVRLVVPLLRPILPPDLDGEELRMREEKRRRLLSSGATEGNR